MYEQIREVLETGMTAEIIDREIYNLALGLTDDQELCKLLTLLAAQEEKHRDLLARKHHVYGGAASFSYDVKASDLASVDDLVSRDLEALILYCVNLETRRARQYKAAADKVSDTVVRQFLLFLSDEELKHADRLREAGGLPAEDRQ